MAIDIVIPSDLWEGDAESVISSWLFNDGAMVKEGALVAEIMTGKVQYEIHAPVSGRLAVKEKVDTVVPKGAVIGSIA